MKYVLTGIVWLLALAVIFGLVLLFGFFTAELWNFTLVPQGMSPIDFIQGACLNTLGGLLTGSHTRIAKAFNKPQ